MGRKAKSIERIPELSDVQSAWLAGFLDGEGHFGIQRHVVRGNTYYTPIIQVSQAGEKGMALIRQLQVEMGGVGTVVLRAGQGNWKPSAVWMLYGEMTRVIAKALLPFLRLKADQAQILIDWPLRRTYSQGRKGTVMDSEMAATQQAIFDQLRLLNAWRPTKMQKPSLVCKL